MAAETAERTWAAVERARAEEASQKSEARLRSLIENLPGSAVFIVDSDLRYLLAEGEALYAAGLTPEQFIGKTIEEAVAPDAVGHHTALYRKALQGHNFEEEHDEYGGTFISRGTPLRNSAGAVYAALAISYDITDRKKMEEALRESEERLRLATAAASIYSWEYDVAANRYSFSENAAGILGVSDLPQTPDEGWQLTHADDRTVLQEALQNSLKTGKGFTVDFRSVKGDGTIVWLSVQTIMVTDAGGKPNRLIGIAQDVSNRKAAEEALRASEERLQTLADAVPQVIWSNDENGVPNYFNQRWYDYSGLTYEQSVGRGWEALVHPDDAPASKEKWAKALAAGKTFDMEYRLRNKEGGYCWHIGRNVPLKGSTGNIIGWFGSATDIEALKKAEEAARLSEAKLEITLESATDYAIITMDTERRIERWSRGAAQIFGYAEEEVIGKPADFIFTDEDRAAGVPQMEMEMARDQGRAADERWHQGRDGARFYMSGFMRPIYNDHLTGYVKVARDATQQKLFTEELSRLVAERTRELQQSNESLQQFATIAAHDLQEPLRKLRMFASILQRFKGELPGEGKELLSKIQATSDRMSQLIREVLQYSKITHGQDELVPTNLHEILKNVLTDLELQIEETGATIVYDTPLPQIEAVPPQMNQLFYNLLTNALKFRQEGVKPVIRITVAPVAPAEVQMHADLPHHKSYIGITFADNGIGFEQQFAEQIFQIFERLHTVEEYEGTGVGLALCKKIVDNHNGHIFAASREGEGASFTIILPVSR